MTPVGASRAILEVGRDVMNIRLIMRVITTALATVLVFASFSSSHAQEIHIVHCLKGCPTGAPATNDQVIKEIFALSSNDDRKFADWVAYRVTKDTIGFSKSLKRDWKSDPALDDNQTTTNARGPRRLGPSPSRDDAELS